MGSSFRALVSERDFERFDILWKNALLGTATEEIDLKLKGGRLPVYLSCSRRVQQDEVLIVFAIASDITERKKAQEALKKAHDELEIRVEQRTVELSNLNDALKKEIEIRKRAEEKFDDMWRNCASATRNWKTSTAPQWGVSFAWSN